MNSGDGKADPSVLAVFQDYVKLMPLVAEANQMSEELKKVSAENGKISALERTLEDRFNERCSPTAPNWLHGVDMPDPRAWRRQVLCPRPHSELVTGPQSTPQASPVSASSPFLLPLAPTAPEPPRRQTNACPPWPPHPRLSSSPSLGAHTLKASLPQRRPGFGVTPW